MPSPAATIHLTKEQGQRLIALARFTLQDRLGPKPPNAERAALEQDLQNPVFDQKTGTFVTLTLNGQLRGCIGSLTGQDPLRDSVRQNALSAGFHDPRFPALTRAELAQVQIEVSVLTPPAPLAYQDAQDLREKLRPGQDGVILRKGYHSATFLPQVWDQLPDVDRFLEHLCRKAGLSPRSWQEDRLEIQTYQVQAFEEGH